MDFADALKKLDGFQSIESDFIQLWRQKNSLIQPLGFLQASLEPQVNEKLEASYSGNALNGLIKMSAQHIVLGLSRFWDGEPPRPQRTLTAILNISDELEQLRKKCHPDWDDAWLQIGSLGSKVSKTLKKSNDFVSSKEFAHMRVFRTEQLAHSLDGISRDRRKFKMERQALSITYDGVISAAKSTIEIFDSLCSHWKFHIENSFDSVALHAGYSRMFWSTLGKLSEIEDESLIFERSERLDGG
jgi:hypothetical protein